MARLRGVRAAGAVAALGLVSLVLAGPAGADEPTPSTIPSTSTTPTISVTPTASESVAPTPMPSVTTTTPTVRPSDQLSLTVAGSYFEDIGSFRLTGALTPARAGVAVTGYQAAGRSWVHVASATTDAAGRYAIGLPVGAVGTYTFRTTLGPPPGGDTATSPAAAVTVSDATITVTRPPATIDSLAAPAVTGVVSPARAGVRVSLDVLVGKVWRSVAGTTTDAAGRYALPLRYDLGGLSRYSIRTSYRAANRPRTEVSPAVNLTRVKVLNAVVRATTAADVAQTYRSGCPVGPSTLRTVTMNFYGYDGRMHRGVMIIRDSLADDVIRAFGTALAQGYPIARMDNPNVYGGNDPRQMKANNTSGFNCRKVVGNPLRQSPHSYGIAIDVNTVQNPYRDARGKWWPSNGKKYIKRSPVKKGMLTKKSALTKQLRADDFFWGGFWNPGRDYQHFEKR